MKYWDNGFYLEQNNENTRLEITDDLWKNLLEEQSKGKEIYYENNELKVRERIITEEDKKNIRINEIKEMLSELDYDIIQYTAGEEIEDIENRKAMFVELHNELRTLLGKEKRKIRG